MGGTRVIGGLTILALAAALAGCGDDEDDTTGAATETAAQEVTVTTGDTEGGFAWDVEPTPTAETESITYVNESKQPHALVFARISEGYTLEEAYKLEGRKGSAVAVAESTEKTSPGPGDTVTIDVTRPIEPGPYALLCPIPGHYQQGQLEEFDID